LTKSTNAVAEPPVTVSRRNHTTVGVGIIDKNLVAGQSATLGAEEGRVDVLVDAHQAHAGKVETVDTVITGAERPEGNDVAGEIGRAEVVGAANAGAHNGDRGIDAEAPVDGISGTLGGIIGQEAGADAAPLNYFQGIIGQFEAIVGKSNGGNLITRRSDQVACVGKPPYPVSGIPVTMAA